MAKTRLKTISVLLAMAMAAYGYVQLQAETRMPYILPEEQSLENLLKENKNGFGRKRRKK